MKNIYKKISISPSFILVIFISFISGLFKDIISLLIVFFIHEMGHLFFAYLYKWNIESIKVSFLGGMISFNEKADKPFNEMLLISMGGVLFQIILFIITYILSPYIGEKMLQMLYKYNAVFIIFNMIPIIPLDGSKVVYIVLLKIMPYRLSLKVLNILSIVNLLILILLRSYKFEINALLIIMMLIIFVLKSIKEVPYRYNKFLYERYVNDYKFKKYKVIKDDNLKKMMINKKHYFKVNDKYENERIILRKRFDLNSQI